MNEDYCQTCERYVRDLNQHLKGHMVEVESKDIDKWELGY